MSGKVVLYSLSCFRSRRLFAFLIDGAEYETLWSIPNSAGILSVDADWLYTAFEEYTTIARLDRNTGSTDKEYPCLWGQCSSFWLGHGIGGLYAGRAYAISLE